KRDGDPPVVEPRLVAFRLPRRQAVDLGVRLDGWDQRGTDERMGERGIPPTAGDVRLELLRGRATEAPAGVGDRAADGGVSLGVRDVDAFLPVGRQLHAVRDERPRARRVSRYHLDVERRRVVTDLGEPEAPLVDEIEGEAIATGRDRTAARGDQPDALARP